MPKTRLSAPNLTLKAPRSTRVRLGGYALLPRILDKCRATINGTNGEYNYACPLDRRFFDFTGLKPAALRAQVAKGLGDGALLNWVNRNARPRRSIMEVIAWSSWMEQRAPLDVEGREFFNEVHQKAGPQREDIATWFELLDLDDHVSFGGQP